MDTIYNALIEALKNYFYWLYEPLLDLLNYIGLFWFELILDVLYFMITLVAIPADIFTAGLEFAGLPPQLLYILSTVGVKDLISIVFAAMGVRMILNLIPASLTRI